MLVYEIPCVLLGFYLVALAWGASTGALFGVLELLIGNAILRAGALSGYTSNLEAARTGAVGGSVFRAAFFVVAAALEHLFHARLALDDRIVPFPLLVQPFLTAGCSALSGVLNALIGQAVLTRATRPTPRGLDLLHAAHAGALGGAILAVGWLLLSMGMLGARKLRDREGEEEKGEPEGRSMGEALERMRVSFVLCGGLKRGTEEGEKPRTRKLRLSVILPPSVAS